MKQIWTIVPIWLCMCISTLSAQLTLTAETTTGTSGQNISVNITVTGFTNVVSLDYTLNYDASILSYNGTSNLAFPPSNYLIGSGTPGTLGASWVASSMPETLPDGSVLLSFDFTIIGDPGTTSFLSFSNDPTPIEANGGGISVTTNDGGVIVETTASDPIGIIVGNGIVGDCNAMITVPVTVEDFIDVGTCDFVLTWDNSVLTYNSVTNFGSTDINASDFIASGNTLTFDGDFPTGVTLADGQTLFDIVFDTGSSNGSTSSIDISGSSATNESGDALTVNETNGGANLSCPGGTGLTLIAPDQTLDCNTSSVTIPITVRDFNSIIALSFVLSWDTAVLGWGSISDLHPSVAGGTFTSDADAAADGYFRYLFSVADPGVTLPDNTVLFNLNLDVLASTDGSTSVIDFIGEGFTALDASQAGTGGTSFTPNVDAGSVTLSCPAGTSITLSVPNNTAASCNDIIEIPVTANGFIDITDFNLDLNWDNIVLSFLDITNINITGLTSADFDVSQTASGTLSLPNWNSTTGVTVPNGNSLFTVRFTVTGADMSSSALTLTNVSAEDSNGSAASIVTNPGNVSVSCVATGSEMDLILPSVRTVDCGNSLSLPVRVADFDEIERLEFSVQWNPGQLIYSSVSAFNLPGMALTNFDESQVSSGILTFQWANATGVSLPNGDDIFTINFVAGGVSGTSNVNITGTPVALLAEATGGTSLTVNTQDNTTTINCTASTTDLTLVAPSGIVANCGTTILVPVSVLNFDNIVSFQFSMDYDPSVLSLTNIIKTDSLQMSTQVITNNNPGEIIHSWSDANGTFTTLVDGAVIFYLEFTVIGGNGAVSNIDFVNTPRPIEARDNNGTNLPVTLENGDVTVNCTNTTSIRIEDDIQVACGGTITIPLTVQDFDNVDSLGFVLNWDPLVLDYVSVGNFGLAGLAATDFDETQTSSGQLTLDWEGTSSVFTDGDAIFEITFNVLSGASNNSDLAFSDLGGRTDNGTALTVVGLDGGVTTDCVVPSTDLEVIAGNLRDTCGQSTQVAIPITVNSFTGINSLSFLLTWDPAIFGWDRVDDLNSDLGLIDASGVNFGYTNVASGELSFLFSVADPGGTLMDGDTLFVLYLDILGTAGSISTVDITEGGPIFLEASIQGGNVSYVPTDQDATVEIFCDQTNPIIDCPSDITSSTDSGVCEATINWVFPNISDDSGIRDTIVNDPHSGGPYPLGETEIEIIAIDSFDNRDTCKFKIFVEDNEPPTLTGCPFNITIGTDVGACTGTLNWVDPVVVDNCDTDVSLVSNFSPGDAFPIGVTVVEYTATDDAGNSVPCSFVVTVVDNEAPTFNACPTGTVIVAVDPNTCTSTNAWTAPTIVDNCDPNPTLTSNFEPSDVLPVGDTEIEYIAVDNAGNIDTCKFIVRVVDNISPTFDSCPNDISTNVDAGSCAAIITWTIPTATDNCDNNLDITSTHNSGDAFLTGTTEVVYVVEDDAGNTDTCRFNVTVVDNERPVFATCPTDITVNTASGTCDAVVTWTTPTATDNCDVTVDVTGNFSSGDTFPLGTTTVQYQAEDDSGNTESCSFNITVIDNERPVFTNCPTDITVSTNAGTCTASPTWTIPNVTDNCAASIVSSSHTPGDAFNVGETTVEYIAEDGSGNTQSCSFTITVIDDEKPVLTGCPSDIFLDASAGTCEAVATWTNPTATDNCDTNPIISLSHNSGDTFPVGTTEVLFIAIDDADNRDTCRFNIIVSDGEKPVFDNCPTDISVNTDPNTCGAIITWPTITATDNCNPNPIITGTAQSGDLFPVGTTVVVFTVDDGAGNTEECRFNVTVTDNERPVFSDCPTNIELIANFATCETTVNWVPPTLSDNCTASIISSSHTPGSSFGLGTTTVEYIAEDASGNRETCSFQIEVSLPEVDLADIPVCEGDAILLSAPGFAGVTYSWTGPNGFTSNMQSPVIPVASALTVGTYTVTITSISAIACEVTADVEVFISGSLVIEFDGNTPLECTDGTQDLVLSEVSGRANQWQWTAPNGTVISTGASVTIPNATAADSGTYLLFATSPTGCTADTFINVVVTEVPVASTLTVDDNIICFGNSVALTGNTYTDTDLVYNWLASSPDAGLVPAQGNTTTATPTAPGVYQIMYSVTNTDNCTSLEGMVTITVETPIEIEAGSNEPILCTDGTQDLMLTATTTATDVASWSWSGPTGFSSSLQNPTLADVTLINIGTYIVTATTTEGCIATDSVIVNITEGPADPSLDASSNTICLGEEVDLLGTEYTETGIVYNWSASPTASAGLVFTDNTATIQPTAVGTYTVFYSATAANGCTSVVSQATIVVNAVPAKPVASVNEILFCGGDDIELSTPTVPGANYIWTGPNGYSSSDQNPTIVDPSPVFSGSYTVVLDVNGCFSEPSEPVEVTVIQEIITVDDIVVGLPGETTSFNVLDNDTLDLSQIFSITQISDVPRGTLTGPNTDGTFTYTPDDRLITGSVQFTYQVCYANCPEICSAATVTIEIRPDQENCDLIPTIITPNGDNVNDVFRIPCLDSGAYPTNELLVFNQWGDLIYQAAPYKNDWGGTYNGGDVPDGTYYVIFRQDRTTEKPVTQFLMIYR